MSQQRIHAIPKESSTMSFFFFTLKKVYQINVKQKNNPSCLNGLFLPIVAIKLHQYLYTLQVGAFSNIKHQIRVSQITKKTTRRGVPLWVILIPFTVAVPKTNHYYYLIVLAYDVTAVCANALPFNTALVCTAIFEWDYR